MKILCTADLHLGRRPSRIPDDLADRVTELTPAAVWRRIVDLAIDEAVDAVVIAGDVVEKRDDFYEALPELRKGVARLAEAGVQVVGTAGNHDTLVLPRLAQAVPDFTLLGRDGEWETISLEGRDGTRVDLLGWSFPTEIVRESPLATFPPPSSDRLTIGILHCDRDGSASRYAPVRSTDLDAAPVAAWLLGHVHKPDIQPGHRPIGYLGSPVGVDPGEPDEHGPWMLEITGGGELELTHLPLAPLRWIELTVDVSDLEEADDVKVRILDAQEAHHASILESDHRPDAVGCRVRLVGRTPLRSALQGALDRDDPCDASVSIEGVTYFVHRWHLEVQPDVDLAEVARGADPAALLARKLLLLRGDDCEARRDLIAAARERLGEVPRQGHLRALGAAAPSAEETADLLEAAALEALDALLAQGAAA